MLFKSVLDRSITASALADVDCNTESSKVYDSDGDIPISETSFSFSTAKLVRLTLSLKLSVNVPSSKSIEADNMEGLSESSRNFST